MITAAENKLLGTLNEKQKTSLSLIREAVSDIWSDDAPRIIKDFTNHGIDHSQRIISIINQLIDANNGKNLSPNEIYLLLTSIYLHDIGMQCDVVRFPEIKSSSETYGANYNIEFTATLSSNYDIDEQKAIRLNHNYLSAAWIDYAKRTGKSAIGVAVDTIPEEHIGDIIDICKFHSKLPISDCPIKSKFDPLIRKQLIATLLRIADELDIDSNRVTFEVIKNFRLDPQNSIYWWLHNRTKIVFTHTNILLITIRLNPSDINKYGSAIHTAWISKFQNKNRYLFNVLAQNSIAILIDADSGIVDDEYADPLPNEIVSLIRQLVTIKNPIDELVTEVSTWLRAIGYEVTYLQQFDKRAFSMLAAIDRGLVKQRMLVRCIEGEINTDDVDSLDKDLDLLNPRGLLISDHRITPNARVKASQSEIIQVLTLSEFLSEMVWGSYFDALSSTIQKERIPELFVDIGCYKETSIKHEDNREKYSSLTNYIEKWANERGRVHISILGEFGTGKTWLCRYYAFHQLERYLKNPCKERLPLLISLRSFTKAMTVRQMINDVLLEQYKLPFVGSAFEILQEMNRQGKLLLILDGFDEMARQVDYQTVVDNFWELANLVQDESKVILTSRTEYFRWAKESEKILGGEEYGRHTVVLSPPKFEVLYLEPLNNDQITQIIKLRMGDNYQTQITDKILKDPNIADMARRPVIIELLLAVLDEISGDTQVNPSKIYLYSTNKLLLRNIDTKRTFTTTKDKMYFLCELAWEMLRTDTTRIHYKEIPEQITKHFANKIKDRHDLDAWDYDLRAQTLLHRDAAGFYEFAHKSLGEFFVALKFAAEIGCLAKEYKDTFHEDNGKPFELYPKSENITELAKTFGAISLNDMKMVPVRYLLTFMIDTNTVNSLRDIISKTKEETPDSVNFVGGNAVTLLKLVNESIIGADLSNTKLLNADLSKANLSEVNARGAYLQNIDFTGCILTNSDFRNSNLTDAIFRKFHSFDSLTWSPSGLFIAGYGGQYLVIWDLKLKKVVFKYRIRNQATVESGNVFSTQEDRIFFIDSNRLMSGIFTNGDWEIKEEHKFSSYINNIALNNRNDLIAVNQNGKILILDIQKHNIISNINVGVNKDIYSTIFLSNHRLAVAFSGQYIPGRLKHGLAQIYVYDISNNVELARFENKPGSWRRGNLATNELGNILITCAHNNCTSIWDLSSYKELKPIKELGGYAIEYCPNTKLLAVGVEKILKNTHEALQDDFRHLLVLLDFSSKEIKLSVGTRFAIESMAFSPDGQLLATSGINGGICIWDIKPSSPTFGQDVFILDIDEIKCDGMKIGHVQGLDEPGWITDKNISIILRALGHYGAVLDESQKKILKNS